MLKRLNIFGILIFIVVFFYLYKKNRKFRKSVLSSFIFVYFLVSETTIASASDADAFSPKNFGNRPSGLHRTNNQGQSGQSSAASGDDNGGSSSGQPGDLPRFPKPEPIEVTEKRRADAERRLHDMENSDEESESDIERNAGSEKKDPSCGSYDYADIMKELDKQSSKSSIEVTVGDQIYKIKNPYRESPEELEFRLAEEMYDSIRECDTDICDIAENLGFKADNIKNVKDHIFYNKHNLDRYGSEPDQIEHRRFDATLQQALAWKRMESGIHTQDDIEWIKHECAERHHELKYDSGYSEAHERAQSRYDGSPWENDF